MTSSDATLAQDVLGKLTGGLIVSVQASSGEPLCAPEHLCALALSAIAGGACGLRLEGAHNIAYIRRHTQLPVIGLTKSEKVADADRLSSVYITSTFEEAESISLAGADIIAIDATLRPRPNGSTAKELIQQIRGSLGKPVWADVSCVEEGLAAASAGADVVSTTLSGYTTATCVDPESGPDMKLLEALCKQLSVPVVLEGRVWHPEEVRLAFELGAFATVVGSAITRPQLITRRFVRAVPAQGQLKEKR